MQAYPTQPMAEKGTSDLRVVLSPAVEKMLLNFVAGLMRSGLMVRASGAKTNPPCAYPTASDAASADARMGTIQRRVSTLVQKRSGPLDSTGWVAASSALRKKSVQ
jgi:hypothetical protein